MVALVIVSHSATLADGVIELAREMGGGEVAIEAAGGMDGGEIGTDAERVREAVERVRSPDGVLVLMDLGSALMSAEMATEMADPDGGPVMLSEAPLVEGAVAAAALAGAGASLEEVAREARGALRMKTEQLGGGEPERKEARPSGGEEGPASELRLEVQNRLGLHARPAARFVAVLGGLDARVEVTNATRDRGPADGGSLVGLATLAVARGDELVVSARGPQAEDALDALRALAAENFGDAVEDAPTTPDSAPEGKAAEALGAGTQMRGVPASPGIAIGPARRLHAREVVLGDDSSGTPAEERARLDAARAAAREELDEVRSGMAARGGTAAADIFGAHAVLLDDAAITGPAQRRIEEGEGAARAWQAAAAEAAAAFRALDDPYMRERAVDVEDVSGRVLIQLGCAPSGAALEGPGIVLAGELTPGEAAGLDPGDAWAIATARGGATAHAAILARALGIPAVVGLGGALMEIPEATTLVLDGEAGLVDVDPGDEAVAARRAQQEAAEEQHKALLARTREPGALSDGRRVEVFANIGSAAEAARAVELGAEGVGLLRTEFLFLDRAEPPTEDEQVEVLSEIAGSLEGRPVVVRTLDAGADKPLPFLRQEPEDNPFLGRRGIRLSLAEPELLRTQLRAILRVAQEHPLKVMFPMVATLEELRAARELLAEAREGLDSSAELEVGVMVEVPALALQAAQFAPDVDFFSVGTNDLAQYTMAAERGNAALSGLLDASRAPVLALIAAVTEAAGEHGPWVGVCGELAGEPDAAVVLAGLGVRELSMAPSRIPAVKAALRESDFEAAAAAARRALPTRDQSATGPDGAR
ncbi:MAG TPA: phosphoenolpyruvate--protein phosphotransferase [Thermoleophilaceae bacterium]|nr:phosphoenolpyruvate--protein phosphotransferase [Thermoleophilaceae bacterium]